MEEEGQGEEEEEEEVVTKWRCEDSNMPWHMKGLLDHSFPLRPLDAKAEATSRSLQR